jgi:two-component system chemotaxis family response regulator WspR
MPAGALQRVSGDLPAGRRGRPLWRRGIRLLLPNTSARAAHTVANRLLTAVHDLRLRHARRPSGFVTVSVGIAALTPGNDGVTASDLVEAADRALYRAKKEGRDRVCQVIDECELPLS